MPGFVGKDRSVLDHPGPSARRLRAGDGRLQTLPEDAPVLRFRLLAIFAAQLFDLVTFTIMVQRHGIQAELNPIVTLGFESGGLPGLFFIKLAVIVLVGSTIVILGRRGSPVHVPSRLASLITVAAVIGGLVGGFSNAITI